MRLVKSLIILLSLTSCSASYHARKAIKKNPQAFKADTTVIIDTVVVEVPKVDTAFVYQFDTVEYVQEDVRIKYFHDTTTQQVYIEADCPDQETVVETKTITLPPIIIKPTLKEKVLYGLIPVALIILVLVGLRFGLNVIKGMRGI